VFGRYYYHQIFRKSIIAFGSCFNNILVKRKVQGEPDNLETIKVPIQYGPTQKYLAMIAAEPNPERQGVQITLPRMSFEIRGLNYDPSRKLVPTQFAKSRPVESKDENGRQIQYSQFLPVPYNLDIELSIISKNQDDGLQILEQLLPNFHPSLNVSIEVIDETKEERDISIVLNSVNYNDEYEGDFTQRRTLVWTLGFTVKTYLFGPVDSQKDIRKVTIDYRTDLKKRPAELRYSAEIQSTDNPPIPPSEIDPAVDNYKVVETLQDIHSSDNDYFSL